MNLAGGLLALLALGASLLAAPASEVKKKKQDLNALRRDIAKQRGEIESKARQENSLLKQVESANRDLAARRRDLKVHEKNLGIIETRLTEIDRRRARFQASIASNRAWLARHIRLMQRKARGGDLALLLAPGDPASLLARYRFLQALASQSARRIGETRMSLGQIESYQKEYLAQERELSKRRSDVDGARRHALVEKRRRENVLGSVRKQKGRSQALLKELQSAAAQIEALVSRLQEQSADRSRTQAQRARAQAPQQGSLEVDLGPSRLGRAKSLPWPLKGRVISAYGEHRHPVYQTTVFNRGVEISGQLGQAVSAVGAGVVRFAGEFQGFGNMVIVDHGGGYFSIYGHLDDLQVKPDQEVVPGQGLGELGDSSTLREAALYFEIRRQARAMNPMAWLKRRP